MSVACLITGLLYSLDLGGGLDDELHRNVPKMTQKARGSWRQGKRSCAARWEMAKVRRSVGISASREA